MQVRSPFLHLLCSALLILPGGWCCQQYSWLNSLSALLKGESQAASTKAAQPTCKHCQPPPQKEKSSPAREQPRPNDNCPSWCCDDGRAAPPQKTIQIDSAPVLFLALIPPSVAVSPTACTVADVDVYPVSPSLQIMNCVWLC